MRAKRNRHKNTVPFDQRLRQAAGAAREAAGKLPEGQQRDALLRKAKQAETAAHLNEWLNQAGSHNSR